MGDAVWLRRVNQALDRGDAGAAFCQALRVFVERADAAVAATRSVRAAISGEAFHSVQRRLAVRNAIGAALPVLARAWPSLRIAAAISAQLNETKLPRTVVPTSEDCATAAQQDVEKMGRAVATMRNREACDRASAAAETAIQALVDAAGDLSEASWLDGGAECDELRAKLAKAAEAVFACLSTCAIARHVFTG